MQWSSRALAQTELRDSGLQIMCNQRENVNFPITIRSKHICLKLLIHHKLPAVSRSSVSSCLSLFTIRPIDFVCSPLNYICLEYRHYRSARITWLLIYIEQVQHRFSQPQRQCFIHRPTDLSFDGVNFVFGWVKMCCGIGTNLKSKKVYFNYHFQDFSWTLGRYPTQCKEASWINCAVSTDSTHKGSLQNAPTY